MIVEHELFFEKHEDPEIRNHGLALARLIRNILNDCRACQFRVHIDQPESGLTLWQTMQKHIIQEALKAWPEHRDCAYHLGITVNQFKRYVNAWNIKSRP